MDTHPFVKVDKNTGAEKSVFVMARSMSFHSLRTLLRPLSRVASELRI